MQELAAQRERPLRITVYEASERAGGCAASWRLEGALLEHGPDTLVTHKPAGLALCRRLGLEGSLAPPPAGAIRVWRTGRLVPLPEGFALIAPTQRRAILRCASLSWKGRLRAACEPWFPARAESAGDESIADFVTRRFGREVYTTFSEPLAGGLAMGNADRLSLRTTAPRIAALERQPGRISGRRPPATPAAAPATMALAGGMAALVRALLSALPAQCLRLRSPVLALARDATGFALDLGDGTRELADAVVLATPAPRAAATLATLDPDLARTVGALAVASCVTVHAAWPLAALRLPDAAHGFFVPRTAGLPLVAATFVHRKFPDRVPAGVAVVRMFAGGALHPQVSAEPDEPLVRRLVAALTPLLGVQGAPLWTHVARHRDAMPQAVVGHEAHVATLRREAARQPGLALAGGCFGAYGLPDAIAAGEAAADGALAFVEGRARG